MIRPCMRNWKHGVSRHHAARPLSLCSRPPTHDRGVGKHRAGRRSHLSQRQRPLGRRGAARGQRAEGRERGGGSQARRADEQARVRCGDVCREPVQKGRG